jgi:RNA polymerase sigma factor (sigma-70 family)
MAVAFIASGEVPEREASLADGASSGSSAREGGEHLAYAEHLADLVRDAARGEAAAWSALVHRLAPLVWSVIRGYRLGSHDGADVSQTTWLRLAQHIGRLHQPERVAAWCATTAGRECLAVIRRNQRQVPTDDAYLAKTLDEDPTSQPEASTVPGEDRAELWDAFSTLPARSQLFLRLLFADPPLSYKEVAAVTGMAVGSIGPTRGRLLRKLREALGRGSGRLDPTRQEVARGVSSRSSSQAGVTGATLAVQPSKKAWVGGDL